MASWPVHTTTALKRWSCQQNDLPTVDAIKSIHVYDFDNTLFSSPLPNKALWTGPTVGLLQTLEVFVNGGWWHDANLLAATGGGIEQEEPRAWAGWWNELIVELVQFSMQQKDNVTILLTGRSEPNFADLIKRILASKKLEFDMICLKPSVGPSNEQFSSTMSFKQALLRDLVSTYREADEIRIYEDRLHHVKGFRDFFGEFNKALLQQDSTVNRKPITAEVVHVSENNTTLDPVVEITEVQRMINSHNMAIRNGSVTGKAPRQIHKSVLFTGYMIPADVSEKLKQFANIPSNVPLGDVRYLADSILIAPRPLHKSALDRIGGLGKKLTWRVAGLAVFENKVWAARVEPVPSTEPYVSENPTPTVVLALLRGARPVDASRIQNWQPVGPGQALEFETMVGEKAVLRVDEERSRDKWGRPNSHKRPREDENVPSSRQNNGNRTNGNVTRGNSGNSAYRSRGNHQRGAPNRGRASAVGGYGRGGGPGGRGRGGRGGFGQYRSLDDVDGGYQRAGGYRDYDSRNGAGYDGAQDEGLYDAY